MAIHSSYRDGSFDGQTVVVSGGGTGIGRATARELAALGAHVVICSRALEHLEPTRDEIVQAGGKVTALQCNIRDPEAVEAFFAAAVEQAGPLHALVNNPGGQFISPPEALSPTGGAARVRTKLPRPLPLARPPPPPP